MRNMTTDQSNLYKVAVYSMRVFMFFALGLVAPDIAYAQNAVNSPMGFILCDIVSYVYGNLGRGLATLAIVIIGVGATLGKVSWGLAMTIGIGIAIIFNAGTIMSDLVSNSGFGASASATCATSS